MPEVSQPLALDHVGWLVEDLDAARKQFEAFGFAVTPTAALSTGEDVQYSAHVVFADTYLELTSFRGAIPTHLAPYADSFGLKILALRSDAAAHYHELLGKRGLALTPLANSQRQVDSGEWAKFCWFMAEPQAFPDVLVCGVEHETPEVVFPDPPAAQRNGATRLAEVLLLTSDPQVEAQRYAVLTGDATRPGTLSILDADAASLRFHGLDAPRDETKLLGISLDCDDLEGTKQWLADHRVDYGASARGIWLAGPDGTVIELRR